MVFAMPMGSMKILITVLALVAFAAVLIARFFYLQNKKRTSEIQEKSRSLRRQIYELAILKELGERVGHSLNIEDVVDIITRSLGQFIEYSATSYMLIEQEKVLFKTSLAKPVSKMFIRETKERMVKSLEALTGEQIVENRIEEVVVGSIIENKSSNNVKSFFNIPLVINEKVLGVLTVTDTRDGLYKEEEMTLLYKVIKQATREIEKLESVVEKEQGKMNAMVKSMAEGVIMTDSFYKVMVVNPAARNALGIKKENPSIFDIIGVFKEDFNIKDKLEESVVSGKIIIIDDVKIEDRSYQIIVSPAKMNTNGVENIFGGVVVLHDITREMEVEKMRKDFTAMMVHELRTPLDGIKKMSELMNTDQSIARDKETYDSYISMIGESVAEMLDLVNQLLDMARIESGKLDLYKKEEDIKQFIKEEMEIFDSKVRNDKIHIEYAIGEDVPQTLSFDRHRIRQVIRALISHAVASLDSEGRILIEVLRHKKGEVLKEETKHSSIEYDIFGREKGLLHSPDSVVCAVTSSGRGYKDEEIKNLFNKFTQFESSIRGKDSSGMGIKFVIAKGIIESHGGIMGAFSKNEQGSTFYFTLKI